MAFGTDDSEQIFDGAFFCFSGDTDQEQMQFIFEDGPKAEEAAQAMAAANKHAAESVASDTADRDTELGCCDKEDEETVLTLRKPLVAPVLANSTATVNITEERENAETDV